MLKSDSRSVANTNASMAVNRSSVAGTSLASTNSTRMISSCYAMPLLDNAIIDNQISVIGRTITCDNYQEFNQKLEFHYDYTYANQHEFAKSAYTFNLAPLVRDALRGESNMILFGGVQSLNIHRFLLSQTVMQGLISQAAGQLLNAVNHTEEKMGSVTFSWYKLDCGTPEVITDVLKAASTITAGGNSLGGGGGSVKSSSDNSSVGNTSGLILREAGKSRGMYVPGLWEIEIANGAEIETVISHVLNAVPQIADHSLGTSHTIMQLSVTNKLISGQAPPPPPGSPGSATYRSTDDYSPVTGRITFLLLSNLSPADQQFLALSSKAPQIPATVSANPNQWFPWVDQLFSILQWLESRRASPPFHKSRLLLILREVLLRRQRASLMLFIHPSIDQHQINIQWMKLFAFLSKDLAPTVVSFTNNIVSSTTSTTSTRRTPSAPRTRPDATDAVNLHSIKKAAEAKRSMTPTNQRNNPSRRSAAPLQTSRSLDLSEHQQRRVPGSATAARRNRSQDDFDLISRHVQNEGEEVYGEEKYEQSRGQMYGTEEDDEDYGEEPSSSVPFATRARSGSNGSAGNLMGNTFPDQSPLPSRNIPEPTITPIAVSSRGPYPLLHQSSTQSTTSNFSASQKMGAGYVEDFNNHETEAALVVALEASRNEASALKIAYNYANDKYNEIKSAYDKLIVQLKEEGSMLEKRDKDRFKNALKDLKDYEIYKEVMETAMMRLQSELENLAKENTELRATKAYEEKQIQKQKNFSERYSKDLVSTKKRLTELETKYAQLEKQNKQLSREKDAAVAALAQTQGSQIQKVSQWQETASIKQREVEDLNKKVKALEERCKTLELEKESVLSSNLHEVANLRSAHSKALETLMGYQEENDVLRSAVVELSSKANSSAQNSRNNSIPPSSSPAINLASASTHSIQANDNATSPNNSPVHTPMPPNVANGGTSKDSNLVKPSLDISNATTNNTNSPNLSSPTTAVLNLAQRRHPIKSTTNYI